MFQTCLEQAIEEARRALEDTFNDEYITCDANLIGCYHELEDCVTDPCIPWLDAPKCRSCGMQEPEELCVKSLFLQSNGGPKEMFNNKLYFLDCDQMVCDYYADTKGSMEATFSCTDNKYFLSTRGDRHLIFSVHASIFMKKRNCDKQGVCVDSGSSCVCGPGVWCEPCHEDG